jgi:hypothetical protein
MRQLTVFVLVSLTVFVLVSACAQPPPPPSGSLTPVQRCFADVARKRQSCSPSCWPYLILGPYAAFCWGFCNAAADDLERVCNAGALSGAQ